MVVGAPGVNTISSQSQGGGRLKSRCTVLAGEVPGPGPAVKARLWDEDLATQFARAAADFSYELGDNSLGAEPDNDVDLGINVVVVGPARNKNSDRPLQTWVPHANEYTWESLRREGRSSPKVYAKCAGVACIDPQRMCPNRVCTGVPEYRWADAVCFGEVMRCAACIVATHAQHPTHFIEKWNGKCFKRSRKLLRQLGLRVQLNHPPGVVCPRRKPAPQDFTLYDVTGVHELAVDFCGCTEAPERRIQLLRACWWPATVKEPNTCATFAALKLFQILNCLGKLSAYDFLRGLEMITNHDGLDKPPDRQKPFMHIMRMWREVKRLKRFKRGHAEGGRLATADGELVLPCRACPQPGWNLPPNWEEIPPLYRFLYFVFLAQDANFRLSNRNVSSEADPILGDGWGFFAKRDGEDRYKAHIGKHVNEKEISTCSGFQAMFLANTKQVKGLRTSGIGGVTCSRHNMWRANGMGDLQVGERYCNLDFLLLSAVMAFAMAWLVVSYNIACQYSSKFWQRMPKLPKRLHLKIAQENVIWKVPNFHLPAHKPPCHSPFSFHYMFGAGKNHGEGVEQNWSFSNGAAPSTKLMGPGSRATTLEDIFGFHNYDRQLAMHRVLPRRLTENIQEGTKHKVALDAFTEGLERTRPEEVAEWRAWVEEWEATQHTTTENCPFEYMEAVRTLQDIQLRIAAEELILTEDGVEVEQENTPSTFISMGLSIEDQQRRLEIDIKALQAPTATQSLAFTKRRTALLKRIHKFRQLQLVYMPVLRGFLSDHEKQVLDGNGEQAAEATRLFMPSEISDASNRRRACAIGLLGVEERMREAEAEEALERVQQGLRSRTMTNRFRIRNYTGQGVLTRGQGILHQINIKIHLAKIHYRYARAALLELRGHGIWEDWLALLKDEDVRALNEQALAEEEEAQAEQLDKLSRVIAGPAGIAVAQGLAAGEGSHTLSWIWYSAADGSADEDDPKLHEALRVEWCKADSRSRRFDEEVRLLWEEMRRTIAYGETAAQKWDLLALAFIPDSDPALIEGRQAYAAEKADRERETCAKLRTDWAGILAKADSYLEGRMPVEFGEATVPLILGDELDPEDEEALLEGDDD
ncbi:CxC2 domain-containing protein [Mycena venus]|uniref:CxC2 domain-containing protein n=1 Tax=Mycena venus TaxID=2733690 RepID=A0A8H7DEP5_9AGAR|nr:CxC2 domain-containing protein [Mycena venus]